MNIKELEPRACPFCASYNLIIIEDEYSWVACLDCCAEGPDGSNAREAIEKWNGEYLGGSDYEN